jgi:hypothetical protein
MMGAAISTIAAYVAMFLGMTFNAQRGGRFHTSGAGCDAFGRRRCAADPRQGRERAAAGGDRACSSAVVLLPLRFYLAEPVA